MNNVIDMRSGDYLHGFQSFIEYLKLTRDVSQMTIVEIGSYVGQSTTMFADVVKHVISIDPFMNDYDESDGACHAADIPTVVYNKFLENIAPYNNITHIRKTSDDAVVDIKNQVDLVYIDGVHTYEQVKKDIANYRGFIKHGGLLCGHDYESNFQGVIDAVDESFGKPNFKFIDHTWVVIL
jgi:hypothetical protein